MDKHSLTRSLILSHGLLLIFLTVFLLLKLPVWGIMAAMIPISGIAIWRLKRKIHQQYELISEVAIQIAAGDHSRRIPNLELGELDEVGKNLNTMLGKLDKTIHHLAVHREELRLVLSTIEDVLWSQNLDGKLEWANSAFQRLFSAYDPPKKQFYWDVIREPQLLTLIKDLEHNQEKSLTELELTDHFYLLSGTHNEKARRRVFILQNIDEIRQAERMKKDFVVNLAHELRTPLTAIKGFSEAMQENPGKDNHRYLTIIQNHTHRLIHLISDLEQLIRLERLTEIDKQEINLNTFFDNIRLILTPDISAKGLYLKIETDSRLPRLSCDPFKLEQVFINLVQNSLRYTTIGGISIRSVALDNEVRIEVSDTGSGIDAIHLPRIFERFYVADPARNRAQSGTGLGLAIVKHIVLLHGGKIEVQSESGKGTTFIIHLPTGQLAKSW